MSTLAKEVHFDDSTMWVELADGHSVEVPLARFPRLLLATPAQCNCAPINKAAAVIEDAA